jgi:RNA polymerase sigma-70 factor (ECF subfamily)
MSADLTVSDLIRRVHAGEQGAREQLFNRYDAYLHVLARAQLGRHLRGKCEASDVVQELLAWLRRILSHNLFNEARRFAAQQRDTSREISIDQVRAGVEHSSVALARGLAADTPTPSQVASQRESAVRLADALAKLPEDYRDVLMLRVFEELPAEEVAQRMNRTAGAVRMLQMRALQALREVMGAETA